MSLKHLLDKPEYLFRPGQALRRVWQARALPATDCAETRLPWGYRLRYHPRDVIGSCIWRKGVYDLTVSEAIWRLLDPGAYAIDVGANIGHMTSVMAARVGAAGRVLAVEPHPDIYGELRANVRAWEAEGGGAQVTARQVAFSDRSGTATLWTTEEFVSNRGTASLAAVPSGLQGKGAAAFGMASDSSARKALLVAMTRLDEATDPLRRIDLLKIDVEGHELAVLEGSAARLAQGDIRDIIFEEHAAYPTPVTAFLEQRGYHLFLIGKRLWGPLLGDVGGPAVHNPFDPPSYLATRDPERARARLQPALWAVLKTRSLKAPARARVSAA